MTDQPQLPESAVSYPEPIPYNRIVVRLETVDDAIDEKQIDFVIAGPDPQANIDHNHATLVLPIESAVEARSVGYQLLIASEALFNVAKAWEAEDVR